MLLLKLAFSLRLRVLLDLVAIIKPAADAPHCLDKCLPSFINNHIFINNVKKFKNTKIILEAEITKITNPYLNVYF
jgi:hypothetical protein